MPLADGMSCSGYGIGSDGTIAGGGGSNGGSHGSGGTTITVGNGTVSRTGILVLTLVVSNLFLAAVL